MTAFSIVPQARATTRAQADSTDPQVIALHAAAENALASALRLLRSLDCDPAKVRQATGRAARAAVALQRLHHAMDHPA